MLARKPNPMNFRQYARVATVPSLVVSLTARHRQSGVCIAAASIETVSVIGPPYFVVVVVAVALPIHT